MEYEEISLLKQSEKSTVHLIREQNEGRLFIRKELRGRHLVYAELQGLTHPYLPKLYDVVMSDDSTTVIEEYIEGAAVGSAELTSRQFLNIARELCSVLEFLHGKGIIHRDIKPSNIILAKDGHIRLIDFDAARMPKDNLEQDTIQLGTRGYAPPEQYGFSQTDERADIYAMGVTLEQLLGEKARKTRYKKILSKCMNLDPDKRYQSARQVKEAFSYKRQGLLCVAAAAVLAVLIFAWNIGQERTVQQETAGQEDTDLIVLPSPANPHWDSDTGTAVWGNVPESGEGSEVDYDWRLYRCDTPTPPDLDTSEWGVESKMRGDVGDAEYFDLNLSCEFWDNGFYYFAVRAAGDGVTYADSPYVLSDAFEYTGEDAPSLPVPEDLIWIMKEDLETDSRVYYASFSNWEAYDDKDSFEVFVYDETGEYITSNIASKENMLEKGWPGIRVRGEFVNEPGMSYRFAIQVTSSHPNEYHASQEVYPWPVEEMYLSPWLRN